MTSKTLYSLSLRFIYRSISFTFNRNRRNINGVLIKRLLTDSDLCAKVREVEVLWAPNANLQPGEGSKVDLELLGQALPRMVGLNAFIWDAQYSIIPYLLDILRLHLPQCKLYAFHPPSQDSARTLPRLRGFPGLFSLDVALVAGQYAACHEIGELLNSTPLTDLAIDTSDHFFNRTEPMLAPLRLRSLEMYSLQHSWCPNISWSMLERLSMDNIFWLPRIASQLTNLKSLHLDIGKHYEYDFLISFLRTCGRLEVLDLTGYTQHVEIEESLWRHLGKTLVKLRFREKRIFVDRRQTPNDAMKGLLTIARECPKLRSLGLEIEDNRAWARILCVLRSRTAS